MSYKQKIKNISIPLLKWWIVAFLGILISNYLFSKLMITNEFLMLLAVTFLLSVIIQIVKAHDDEDFRLRWFIFYFLIYVLILQIMGKILLPKMNAPNNLYYFIIVGLIISIVTFLVRKVHLRSKTIPLISFILLFFLLVNNLTYLQDMGLGKFIPDYKIGSNPGTSENKQPCPTTNIGPSNISVSLYESTLNIQYAGPLLKSLINTSIWRIENDFRSCYKGKYQGQHPDWIYCDDMIVSRWETGSSGTINYRWYTAVSAEWKPSGTSPLSQPYALNGFACENGQKVTVEKGVTNYYVYDSRDGTKIQIKY